MKRVSILLVALIVMSSLVVLAGCSLPSESVPLTEYIIEASLDAENMTVSAEQTVNYINNTEASLDSLYFNLYPAAYREDARYSPVEEMYNEEAYLNGVSYGGIEISSVSIDGEGVDYEIGGVDDNVLMVGGVTIDPTEQLTVSMEYELTLPEIRHRFGYYDNIINLGNWYPILGVYEDGNWQCDPYYSSGDPFYSEVADYDVSISVPTGWTVASTGHAMTSIDGEDMVCQYEASNVRDFAMVLSSDMSMQETDYEDITIRYYYQSDENLEENMQLMVDALSTFTDLFGSYPYEQLSVVQTNFQQGGMEYPQLVYISNALNDELYQETIIHEIAHQWWYGVVGNDQINEAWMDEGLAEYSTSMFYEANPDYGITIEDRVADSMKAYVLFNEVYSAQITDTSMDRALDEYFSSIDYAYHAYVKSALMFDSLRHMIGDDSFFDGLKLYYETYAFDNAERDDLVGAFESSSNINLNSFFTNWLDGEVSLFV